MCVDEWQSMIIVEWVWCRWMDNLGVGGAVCAREIFQYFLVITDVVRRSDGNLILTARKWGYFSFSHSINLFTHKIIKKRGERARRFIGNEEASDKVRENSIRRYV